MKIFVAPFFCENNDAEEMKFMDFLTTIMFI
jgi:hypothetical protein